MECFHIRGNFNEKYAISEESSYNNDNKTTNSKDLKEKLENFKDKNQANLSISFEVNNIKGKDLFKYFEQIDLQCNKKYLFIYLFLAKEIKSKLFKKLFDSLDSYNALKRVCKFCEVIKPNRSHHCRTCRKCILKYDHHCHIVNNCIGFFNYKFFYLLLFYTILLIIFILISSIQPLIILYENFGIMDLNTIFFSFFILLALIILYFSFILFYFHNKIMLQGYTTLESIKIHNEISQDNELLNKNKQKSIKDCLQDCLGINNWAWFLPIGNLFYFYF